MQRSVQVCKNWISGRDHGAIVPRAVTVNAMTWSQLFRLIMAYSWVGYGLGMSTRGYVLCYLRALHVCRCTREWSRPGEFPKEFPWSCRERGVRLGP